MKKRGFLIYLIILGFIFVPKMVLAKSFNVVAGAGRSAVMNPSGTYYYTQWKGLSSDSLNILPIPYPNGDYYLMGSEYSFAITLTGEKSFRGHVTIPVSANTIYNYTMTNGLLQADGSADLHFGIDQNFGVYNMGLAGYNATWSCNTYTNNLGVAHNLCFYDIEFSFNTETNYEGAYNLNVAVLNTTGNRSAYYYTGLDSNGNGIEFPVNASGTQYSTVRPYLSMTGVSGDSSSPDNTEEILNGVSQASAEISQTIQESYENLVKSQEVCFDTDSSSVLVFDLIGRINGSGELVDTSSSFWKTTSAYTNGISNFKNTGSPNIVVSEYDSNKNYLGYYNLSTNQSKTLNPTYFYRFSSSSANSYVVSLNYCQNGNQALYDEFQSVKGSILDETIENFKGSQGLNDIGGQMTTDTPITDLLALPITLLSAIVTGVNGTCSNFNLGNLWGTNLIIPCINPELYIGTDLWNLIDLLFCGFMIFNIAQLMIHDYSSISSAQDLFDETYTPRHEKMRRS